MKFFISVCIGLFVLFGCGGGGSGSKASSDEVIKALATKGQNGANYTFRGSLKVSWNLPIMDNVITLNNFKLKIQGVYYPVNYTTSKSISVDKETHLAQPGSVNIPFAFVATLPYSSKSRIGTLEINYKVSNKTNTASIPIELIALAEDKPGEGDKETSIINTIESSSTSSFNSQAIHYIGQVKKGSKAQTGVAVNYSILTPTYISSSKTDGVLMTDKNGVFTLRLNTTDNPLQADRQIVVLFGSEGSTSLWKVTQNKNPGASEFKMEKTFSQNSVARAGGNVKYIGKLLNANTGVANQTISYEVLPSNAVLASSGTTSTDAFGNFTIDLNINANTTGANKDINVVIKYQTASATWSITQSSQDDTKEYTITIVSNQTIFANGGEYKYIGIVRDKNNNQVVSGASVSYSVLAPSYIESSSEGVLTTDANGKFTLNLDIKENTSASTRNIPVVFTYNGAVEVLTIAQNNTLQKTPYIVDTYLQSNVSSVGSRVYYYGKLTNNGLPLPNETIEYRVYPDGAATTSRGSVTTDANGKIELDLDILANPLGTSREIDVVLKYKDQTKIWSMTQGVNTHVITLDAPTKVSNTSGTITVLGKLVDGIGSPVNANVNFRILEEGIVTAITDKDDNPITNNTIQSDSLGGFIIKLTFAPNNAAGAKPREATVVFTYENAKTIVKITQDGV